MEAGGSSIKGNRHVWMRDEDETLLIILKDVVARGQRCDTGSFKTGTINLIERQLAEMCVGSGLKANPHIKPKLKKWKKQYSLVYDMLNKNSFGWNDTLKCVDVDSDEAWRSYVQYNKNAQGWRGISFAINDRLALIFGKNRAIGVGAQTPIDMVDDLDQDVEAEPIGVDDTPSLMSVNQTTYSIPTTESHSRRSRKPKVKDNDFAQGFHDVAISLNQLAETIEQFESNYPKYLAVELDRLGFPLDENHAISKAMDLSNVEVFKIIKTDAEKIEFAMRFMNEQ